MYQIAIDFNSEHDHLEPHIVLFTKVNETDWTSSCEHWKETFKNEPLQAEDVLDIASEYKVLYKK